MAKSTLKILRCFTCGYVCGYFFNIMNERVNSSVFIFSFLSKFTYIIGRENNYESLDNES